MSNVQRSKREVTLASVRDVWVAFVPIGAIAAVTWLRGGGIHTHTVAANTCIWSRVLLSLLASRRFYSPVQHNRNSTFVCLIESAGFDIAGFETEGRLIHQYHVVARTAALIVFVEIDIIIRYVFRDIGLTAAGTITCAILQGLVALGRATYYILDEEKCIWDVLNQTYTVPFFQERNPDF